MKQGNWKEILGWGTEELDDIRFVAYTYIKQGQYDIAITFFEALTTLSKDYAYDFQTLGGLYLEKGNLLQALDCLDKALSIDPLDEFTKFNRAKTLLQIGKTPDALKELSFLQNSSDKEIASAAKALLISYQ